jgi:DNA gyrase inhibitor GyrI
MNLTPEFETVNRPLTHYVFLEKQGPFPEVAPPLWNELMPLLGRLNQQQVREYLGLSGIDKTKLGEETMIYQAGVALAGDPVKLPDGLRHRVIKAGKYARFLLTGPYSHIWMAFDRIFKTLAEKKVELRPEFCIENYVNDPRSTPEDQFADGIARSNCIRARTSGLGVSFFQQICSRPLLATDRPAEFLHGKASPQGFGEGATGCETPLPGER